MSKKLLCHIGTRAQFARFGRTLPPGPLAIMEMVKEKFLKTVGKRIPWTFETADDIYDFGKAIAKEIKFQSVSWEPNDFLLSKTQDEEIIPSGCTTSNVTENIISSTFLVTLKLGKLLYLLHLKTHGRYTTINWQTHKYFPYQHLHNQLQYRPVRCELSRSTSCIC